MMMTVLLISTLIALQGPDGQTIWLNPDAVISVREPRGIKHGHWPAGVRCLIITVDGKFIALVESCDRVRQKLGVP